MAAAAYPSAPKRTVPASTPSPGRTRASGRQLSGPGGRWAAALAYRVSCPSCDDVLTLADDVKVDDTIDCCGRRYRLSFEYGAFAAEEP